MCSPRASSTSNDCPNVGAKMNDHIDNAPNTGHNLIASLKDNTAEVIAERQSLRDLLLHALKVSKAKTSQVLKLAFQGIIKVVKQNLKEESSSPVGYINASKDVNIIQVNTGGKNTMINGMSESTVNNNVSNGQNILIAILVIVFVKVVL